ncbi:up-regulator of cell proliferation-like [Mya arenaria]|uniref:up-regulator of cell proliferation-like n=1 Tax=Mya arenaria TaxID=6604 RepID=UPI0022E6BACC|nr:up-regulator of cell proliferation-like [Mya arenaria]
MGVDISTYRARIGTFSGSTGVGVTHEECLVNFTFGLKTVGAVMFIGMLLIMGGVEQNPGPPKKEPSTEKNRTQLAKTESDPLSSESVTIYERSDVNDIENSSDSYGELHFQSIFKPIFPFFGLTGRVNKQISVSEARILVEDNSSSGIQPTEAPMMLLRGLLSMNYETRDAYTFPLQDSQPQVQHGQRTNRVRTRKRVEVSSPSDLFMATFYCCDPMLQSILFEKLFLCKCAVPFFYKDLFSMNYTVALWPLRSLSAVQITEGCYTSCNMIDVETHVISFARLGRPNLSKSTVLNSLISSENTFYNGDCNGGRSKRNISGFCEMFSSPACGSGGDLFKDPTHFLNLRGDLISDFCSEVYSFVNAISDCVVIAIDIQQLERNYDDYINVISKFSSVILLFSEDTSNDVTTERLKADPFHKLHLKHVHCLLSDNKKRNVVMIRIPKEYDFVIQMTNESQRREFIQSLKQAVTDHEDVVDCHETKEKHIYMQAFTQKKRNPLLERFFKIVFSEVEILFYPTFT